MLKKCESTGIDRPSGSPPVNDMSLVECKIEIHLANTVLAMTAGETSERPVCLFT